MGAKIDFFSLKRCGGGFYFISLELGEYVIRIGSGITLSEYDAILPKVKKKIQENGLAITLLVKKLIENHQSGFTLPRETHNRGIMYYSNYVLFELLDLFRSEYSQVTVQLTRKE